MVQAKMKIWIIPTVSILLILNFAWGQTETNPGFRFDGYMLGAGIRQWDAENILSADIPLIEARIPVYSDNIQLKYGGYLHWGITKFFVEWNYGTGIIVYPAGKIIGLSGNIRLGSFFLDNVSYTGALGIHIDIASGKNTILSIECEYFYRNSQGLLDYVSFP